MKHIHTFEGFINEATNKAVTKQDWDKADDEQRKNWLLSAIKDPDDIEDLVNAKWEQLPDVATSNMMKESINEATDYAVMLIGGSIGDKPRPRDAKGYAGMDIDKEQELTNLNDAKAKAKRMNANLSPGEKSHYGLKYVVVPAKDGKFIKESLNEAMDTKYWAGYNKDTSGQGNKDFEEKSKDFDDTFSLAVSDWNQEADGAENRIKGAQIDKVKKIAQEFFKKEGYISVNIAQAMIAQES